jgi:hypothetical protein
MADFRKSVDHGRGPRQDNRVKKCVTKGQSAESVIVLRFDDLRRTVMAGVAVELEAISKVIVFISYCRDLPDPRYRGEVLYPLDGLLLSCLLAGAETFLDIAR